ncbi:hypothetical protein I020019A2_01830 [Bifidobacterium pseudocatenulatum]
MISSEVDAPNREAGNTVCFPVGEVRGSQYGRTSKERWKLRQKLPPFQPQSVVAV